MPVTYAKNRLRSALAAALAVVFIALQCVGGASAQPANQDQPDQSTLTDADAAALLSQMASGFESRNQKKVLGVFDLPAMQDGPLFKQQIISFFSHTESISIHFNLVRTSVDAGKATAEADVEMEAAPRDSDAVPIHKRERLVFMAEKTQAGWKFTDVQPRSFFSLQP